MDVQEGDFTAMISRPRSGAAGAGEVLESAVYQRLRSLAAAQLRRERHGHTLSATALANEAWLRFSPVLPLGDIENQRHLCAVAVTSMRRILVEHARARNAGKRGGRHEHISLSTLDLALDTDASLLALDDALREFEQIHPRASKAVELKFFFGFTHDEVARVTGVQRRTVDRDLSFARAWLLGQLRRGWSTGDGGGTSATSASGNE